MPDSSTASWSAVSLLTGYASRAISPVGVVSDVARRMREWEPLVNAVTTANLDDALGAARESERRWREGSARPLEGVPVMVKDLIDTAGLRTARGSAIFDDRVPCADAAVVRRVREAGAVIVAKTATHEFGWGITTESAHFGPTRNPWNIERSPGGSSGGSAAGLAAGYGPLALGTDTAGSVRIPAGFCGVVGLRPTFGAIETSGVFPLAPSLDQVGLMARTVSDVRLLWSSLGLPATTRDAVRRIGLPMGTDDAAPIDPAIATTCESAAAALADAGYEIIEFPPDCIPPAYSTLASTILSEGYRTHRARGLWPDRAGEYGTDVRRRLELAEHVDRAEYSHAAAQRVVLQATMSRIFQTVDVLLSPVSLTAPTYVGREDPSYRERVMSCTAPQSLAGLPSLVVRAGFDNGMPIGVQLTAQPRGEAKLLHIGTHLEELNGPETERWPEIPAPTGPVEQSGPTYQHEEN